MAENLKSASFAAGLPPTEQKKIDDLNKVLNVHRQLSNLPSNVAKTVYKEKTPGQQQALIETAGEEDPVEKPNRGWLGTAWHYTGGALFTGVQELSDLSTRLYRTGVIALDQSKPIFGAGNAWDIANDNGDKVFNPNRIEDAKAKFGNDRMDIAIRIASGEAPEKIIKESTPEQAQFVRLAFKKAGTPEEQGLMQDALDAAQAAKYSPGRQVANLILPKDLEGSGFFYKAISGAVDAAFRIKADPTLFIGKIKRGLDVKNYAVDVLLGDAKKGGTKMAEYFAKPTAIKFWDTYGAQLDELAKAEKTGETVKMLAAQNQLKALAPEFGPAVVRDFIKADVPVTNALTAKAYFQNAEQLGEMMKGAIGRKRVLAPRLDVLRQTRIKTVTTANKVFNLDRIGSSFVDDMFFNGAATNDGISKMLIEGKEEIVSFVKNEAKSKDVARYSMSFIQKRIDNLKAKFTAIPLFENDLLDVTAKDASEKVFRLARTVLPQRESKLITEAFRSAEAVGTKKDIFYGLWATIADIRGMDVIKGGNSVVRQATGKTDALYALGRGADNPSLLPNGESIGLIASDMSNFVSAPSIRDIDRLASRTALAQKILGVGNSKFVENATSLWSFLTLAGPRYAIRNAAEDLMVHLAVGDITPWGVATARMASTRIRTAKGVTTKVSDVLSLKKSAENPLGATLRFINKKEAEAYAKEFEAAGGTLKAARVITARAINEGKLNSFFGSVGLKKLNKQERALLSEQILHGDLNNALADVVEGGKNAFAGTDYTSRAVNFTREHGVRTAELKFDLPETWAKERGRAGFTRMAPLANEGTKISWAMRIGYYSNDELGGIAVANLDNEKVAVAKIVEWLSDPANKKVADSFRWKDFNVTQEQHAQKIVASAKQIFEKENGDLNLDLLSKVRSFNKETGEWGISGKISLDDLPTNEADVPKYILGPNLIPVSESGNITSSLLEKGWNWLGEANARLSREPIVLAEMIRIRKQFAKSGFDETFIAAHLKNVDPADAKKVEKATSFAKKKLAEIVEDNARLQTLAYIDNPMVRSQMAFSIRNFARFYRAQEDFYRRMYRVVRYNPEAIAKASLTYEGITHSGWIQEDDQGEAYFVYPGMEAIYTAVRGTMAALGVPAEFKTPLPVNFGAQVKMLTPSLNPDTMLPQLSGPLAGISISMVSNLVDIFRPGAADTVTRYALGKYAVDQSTLSAFLPAHINRLYAAMDQNERDSQYASAWRKAVTYLEASGNGIPKRYEMVDGVETLIPPSAAELEEYRLKVKNTTLGILGTRFVFGFFAPASPSVQLKSETANWVTDNGRANFKQVWNKLLDQYPGDYDAAMAKWVELFPDQIPFTVTESERKTVGYFRYAEESGKFVTENSDLFSKYRQGAAFLIPHTSGFSFDAYKTMKDMGLLQNKRVEDYLREVQTSADLQTYYQRKEQYETALESAGIDYTRSKLRKEFDDWKTKFFAGRPLVAEELSQGSQKAIERMNALNDLTNMLKDDSISNIRPDVQNSLRAMVDLYNEYKDKKDRYDNISGLTFLSKSLKERTIIQMRELALANENTQAAYEVLFGRLLGD